MSISNTEIMTSASSAVTASTLPPPPPSHLLEISIISAQNLAPISKSMRTYALTWVNPNRKLSTATDAEGNNNPTWNRKFAFPIDEDILDSDNSAVNVEIYTSSWFRDVIVGTVRVLVSDLFAPSARSKPNSKNIRFVALQVRRPSGSPQGILNMGVRLLDSSMRSMPLPTPIKHDEKNSDSIDRKNEESNAEDAEQEKEENPLNEKVQLWRSLSTGSAVTPKQGSVTNGSMVNGSELCSDIGPSASIVAAELAMKSQPPPPQPLRKLLKPAGQDDETGSSILEELTAEEARAKGYEYMSGRWRSAGIAIEGESMNRITRRKSDGEMFTCSLGNQFGIQFTISCGAPRHEYGNKKLIATESRCTMSTETNSG